MYSNVFKLNTVFQFFYMAQKGLYGKNLKISVSSVIASAFNSFFVVIGSGKYYTEVFYPSKKKFFLPKYANYTYDLNNAIKPFKRKIVVRGIAKNPVDHPNGGRTNTKNPLRTPWGFIAKSSK